MDKQAWDSKQIYTRLVGRYGPSQGLYLFGEYCLLMAVGLDAFQRRHTPHQLRAIALLLQPLQLWPFDGEMNIADHPDGPPETTDPLELVAKTLLTAPLQLALGPDLFRGCLEWAAGESGGNGDPGAWFEPARAALTQTLGFMPPRLTVVLGDGLHGFEYRLFVRGRAVEEGVAFPGLDLILGPEDEAPPELPYRWERDPAGTGWVAWMPIGEGAEPPDALPRLHWMTGISRHLSASLPRHAADLLTVRMTQELLLEAEAGGYDHELERYISVPELRFVFQTLLRQRVPLRPLPKMLEGVTRFILEDLSRRKLAHEELEKINRQLPFFPTARLAGVIRQSIGLSEEAPPRFTPPGPPGPARLTLPLPDAATRAQWEALFTRRAETLDAGRRWLQVFRHGASPAARMPGPLVIWGMELGRGLTPLAEAEAIYRAIDARGQVPRAARMLTHYVETARMLRHVAAWLQGPGRSLDGEAASAIAEPAFERWRWMLNEPERWAAQYDGVSRTVDAAPSERCDVT